MKEFLQKSRKNTRIIILGLCFLIIILLAVLLRQGNKGNIFTPGGNGQVHDVILTEDGYQPERLTIKKGDTIKFSSKRNQFHWPASNLHPTHDIYPEFDPKEPIEASKSWSFRFEKVGTWKFHDHLAPYYIGTIEVKE